MKACASCPARHQADTLDALAQAVEGVRSLRSLAPVLRERAKAIRDAGCTWWWAVQYKHEETGQIKTVELCGGEALPKSLEDFAGEIKLASGTIQADRSEQKKALDAVETAAREMGLKPIMESLVQVGLRAAVGHRIEEQRREIAAGEGDPE